ncbi:MAG: hypothetical protein COT73_10170 [Bdellovibrio sp. CG10_big_fil_rev_8_21_14_0_10_47_8]|nr:MAG: hypothetical protein COT73_10170 [Bdellovibrio sp. CG10_big_fil_rev_8_21_14_0_10_47_8]
MIREQLGGKAFGLYWLQTQGFLVPEWKVVLSSELDFIFQDNHGPRECHQNLLTGVFRSEFLKIAEKFSAWSDDPLAVRSSAAVEDGEIQSFAGVFESKLNVHGIESLAIAIEQVAASFFSERALDYLRLHKFDPAQVKFSIIVQKMVDAEKAGVAFTCNPVTKNRRELQISWVPGLGENLVSGLSEAGEILLDQQGQVLRKTMPSFWSPMDDLSAEEIASLEKTCRHISDLQQRPVDIEWALHAGSLYILQVRPITSSLSEETSDHQTIFDNSNIQESYCGPTTPLTFSYATKAYEKVYEQLMRYMGFSLREIEASQFRHQHLLGYIHHRIYYNINFWYQGLLYLPHFGRQKQDMERMMGLEKPVDLVHDVVLSRSQKIKNLPKVFRLLVKMGIEFARMDALVAGFDRTFWKIYQGVDRTSLYRRSAAQLLEELEVIQKKVLAIWAIPVLNDFLVMMINGRVARAFESAGMKDEWKDLLRESELESLQPTMALYDLAKKAQSSSELMGLLRDMTVSRGLELRLQSHYPDFFEACMDYIERFGDRSMGELKLETLTMREDHEKLYSVLREYLAADIDLSKVAQAGKVDEEKIWMSYRNQSGWLSTRRLRKQVRKLKKVISHREKMRFHRTRSFGLMRSYYLEIGARFSAMDALAEGRDIFFMTMDEISDYARGKSVTLSLRSLVELRKQEYQQSTERDVPGQVQLSWPIGWSQQKLPKEITTDTVGLKSWSGLGCSSGTVEGLIKVVRSPEDATDLSGLILVAERTDPGWTPLFALVKGVIVEKGSSLSHSAVIAREMGIPAIAAVPQIMQQLRSGQKVRMNGSTGRIELLDESADLRAFVDHSALEV